MMKKRTKQQNRRFYLHKKVKQYTALNAKKRQLHLQCKEFANIPKPHRYHVGQLIKMGYNVQLTLF